jgi:chorismate--pyruvate lyase
MPSAPLTVPPIDSAPGAYPAEPVWHPARRVFRAPAPAGVRGWLLDRASLTQRLIAACTNDTFRVEVIHQGWGRPMVNEAHALGLAPSAHALIRQVYLCCGAQRWVYARTVMPATTLTGPRRRLRTLRSRSLGAVLFADPTMTRGEVEVVRLTPRDKLHHYLRDHQPGLPAEVWGRRSVFRLGGAPLLVSEIFLPGIPPCQP